jgi:aryl-alcohol dehydrogenase-like predicted oxidoreductase
LPAGQAEAVEQRNLGTGRLRVAAVGMGCMGLSQGYGPARDEDSVRAIHQALDAGVTLLDTAMSYGQGHNEQLVGRALASWPGGPGGSGGAVVATKFGIVRGPGGVRVDGHPEHVRGYCEASLRRLGRDVIDLYYLHRVDADVPVADTVGAMAELVRAGQVRYLGLSEVTPGQLAEAVAVHPVAAVQFEWSLLWREPEDGIVPAARRLGVGLVPYSPLGRGLLTATLTTADIAGSDFRRDDPRFRGGALAANLAQVAALRGIAAGLGITPGQLALAWLLAQGGDVVPIPGSRHAARIAENASAAAIRLRPADLARLEAAAPRAGWAGDRRSFAAPATTRGPA